MVQIVLQPHFRIHPLTRETRKAQQVQQRPPASRPHAAAPDQAKYSRRHLVVLELAVEVVVVLLGDGGVFAALPEEDRLDVDF